jgi:glucokinase
VEPAADLPILAIDLGGTQIRAAHVSPDLTVSCRRAAPTGGHEGVDAVVSRLAALAAAVQADARSAGLPEPVGIGISSPGPLDPWHGVVVAPPNLPGWNRVPLAAQVGHALGLPTFLERDTNVAVCAEWRHGAGAGRQDVIYVTISTGIGGGIVLGGRPLIGVDGTAGEIGHLTVELDGPLCGDGQPGHVEAIGSGTAIAREGSALLARGESPGLAALVHDPKLVSAEQVARAADAGDGACRALLDHAFEAIGAMCAGLVNVLNPEVIVLGGSIAQHQPRIFEAVRFEIERRAFPVPAARVELSAARFGEDVSLIGALPIVNQRLHDPAFERAYRSYEEEPA